jgi:hypothetical protein
VDELEEFVRQMGGVEWVAEYLEVDPGMIELALSAPEGAWTDRVSQMVLENTGKLILMPSQGGFFWRLTRRRVVKDWRILAQWSDAKRTS